MVTAPDIHVELGFGGTGGHDQLTVTNDLGVWIPSGMDVGLRHGSGEKKGKESAFGELGSLTGFLEAVLAAFLGTRVTAEVALNLEWFAIVRRKIAKGPSRTLLDGIGLTSQTTPTDVNEKVVLGLKAEGLKRSLDRSKVDRVVIEIVVARATIDGDATGSGNNSDPSNSGFTASRSPIHNAVG
jgi:hypothetical protein